MKTRPVLIAGNWKMNSGPEATGKFFKELKASWEIKLSPGTRSAFASRKLQAAIYPPAISLSTALPLAKALQIDVGSQNTHWEKSGAFTGEISGPQLLELGINSSLVGHSERRQYFGETDETARKRTESLCAQGISVILCIGETRSEREAGLTESVILRQLSAVFPDGKSGAFNFLDGRLVIAYEPVWAIGTGLTATPEQAEEAHQMVRRFLWDRCGLEASGRTPILYGGSVTPDNITTLLGCPNIDGALVGGASLKPESYLSLVEAGGRAVSP